jgi:uncharacterized protein YacL
MTAPTPNPILHPRETAERERALLLRIVRLTCIVLFVTVGVMSILEIDPSSGKAAVAIGGIALKIGWNVIVGIGAALAAGVVVVEVVTSRKKIGTIVTIFLGLLVAMLGTYALGRVIDLLVEIYDIPPGATGIIATSKVLLGIGLAYLCISTVLATQDDFRLVIPYVEFAKQIRGPRPLVLDTSCLIDARFADLCQTGIIQYPIVIPHFVVAELQQLADSQDKLKRARGRRGLDVITRLQRTGTLDISIDQTVVPGKAVDQMLVELAKGMDAVIVTSDVGLNRVASIQGVRVLNLNDVANSLKPALVPGEQLSLKLIKPGEQPQQGVGYLDDGTMVVAEDGRGFVGQQVTLTLTSTLQTSAGRLLFGRIVDGGEVAPLPPHHEESREEAAADVEDHTPPPPGMAPVQVAPPEATRPPSSGPHPPKPPTKRVNPFRNPRR